MKLIPFAPEPSLVTALWWKYIAPPSSLAWLLIKSKLVKLPTVAAKYTAPPLVAVLLINLQLSIFNVPKVWIAPPLPLTLALINVIPLKVTVTPSAILKILAFFWASIITFPLPLRSTFLEIVIPFSKPESVTTLNE